MADMKPLPGRLLMLAITVALVLPLSGGVPASPARPGPDKGPCTTPVSYYALVINGGDHPPENIAHEAAAKIVDTLKKQNYSVTYLGQAGEAGVGTGNRASKATIEAAIKALKAKVKCVDRVLIVIVGHGLKKDEWWYGTKAVDGGVSLLGNFEILTPAKLNELLSTIQACPGQDCKTTGVTCHMSIVFESCHSGNFLGILRAQGRTVAVSSASSEVSQHGSGGKGGAYSEGFLSAFYDAAADTDGDGYVSVAEAHRYSVGHMQLPKGVKQTPDMSSQECECAPQKCVSQSKTSNTTAGQSCKQGEYASSNCNGVCKRYQRCTKKAYANCYTCVNVCAENEYADADCRGACGAGYCALKSSKGPCYECRTNTPSRCQSLGLYDTVSCDGKCTGTQVCTKCTETGCYRCQ